MKGLFYSAILLLVLFEAANVYFIMPLPGSQEMKSIDLAFFLNSKRWLIRGVLILAAVIGFRKAWKSSMAITLLSIFIVGGVAYMTHFKMAADTMFYQPKNLEFLPAKESAIDPDRLIIGVEYGGEAKAYPVQFVGYHHKVPDTIGGKPIIVTYCTVCRSGRVFEPVVEGHHEVFRLVGMDHYNAMFEDRSTKSWWRQATGEAIAGPLKGQQLPEVPARQTSLAQWLKLYPHSLIMQADSNFTVDYADLDDYESGRRPGRLTRRDSASWKDKSWIAGIEINGVSKAYDWNDLVTKQVINDMLDTFPVSVLVTADQKGLFAFRRQSTDQQLTFRNDTLTDGVTDYSFAGLPMDTTGNTLRFITVYQEYWHSWRTFHPKTLKY